MKIHFLLLIVTVMIATSSFAAKDSTFAVKIVFNNKVGEQQLELGKTFPNVFNEPFAVTRLKYYISNLAFYRTDGRTVHIPASYFLVNEEDSASKSFSVSLKDGVYNSVSFLVGVDSIKNVSGIQTDALDPMNGMFWTWNSGYIMAKLEATSPLSKSPNQLIEYHIGGFRANQNTVRRVTLSLPENEVIRRDRRTEIVIEADINKWFAGQHNLKIAEHTACTTSGELAVEYADNYANMFSVGSTDPLATKQ